MQEHDLALEVRKRLVEIGGRTSQDLGASRILGQVLIHLYLQEKECSLDDIALELGLSKASVSIAGRQLEQLGLIKKVWLSGDRKNYYKTADNIAGALQEGVLAMIRKKVILFGEELEIIHEILIEEAENGEGSDLNFIKNRVDRARDLQSRLNKFLDNPIVKFFTN